VSRGALPLMDEATSGTPRSPKTLASQPDRSRCHRNSQYPGSVDTLLRSLQHLPEDGFRITRRRSESIIEAARGPNTLSLIRGASLEIQAGPDSLTAVQRQACLDPREQLLVTYSEYDTLCIVGSLPAVSCAPS